MDPITRFFSAIFSPRATLTQAPARVSTLVQVRPSKRTVQTLQGNLPGLGRIFPIDDNAPLLSPAPPALPDQLDLRLQTSAGRSSAADAPTNSDPLALKKALQIARTVQSMKPGGATLAVIGPRLGPGGAAPRNPQEVL